jgi:cytidylate kinase
VAQDQDVAQGVVAIDGPSGSGKSTVARGVAAELGFGYLDTGAMYRALTWLVLQRGPALDQLAERQEALVALMTTAGLELGTEPTDRQVRVDGQDVTEVIRGSDVTTAVSVVAAIPAVRAHLGALQRALAAETVACRGGMVMEGRDIGTAIFPGARLKIWLTATAEARGQRRAAEVTVATPGVSLDNGAATGPSATSTEVETVVEQLARRDRLDSTRQLSPLHCADDAHVIDTTPLSATQVINKVLGLWGTVVLPDAHARQDQSPGHRDDRCDNLSDSRTGASG